MLISILTGFGMALVVIGITTLFSLFLFSDWYPGFHGWFSIFILLIASIVPVVLLIEGTVTIMLPPVIDYYKWEGLKLKWDLLSFLMPLLVYVLPRFMVKED